MQVIKGYHLHAIQSHAVQAHARNPEANASTLALIIDLAISCCSNPIPPFKFLRNAPKTSLPTPYRENPFYSIVADVLSLWDLCRGFLSA
jgi:hypothetical protein